MIESKSFTLINIALTHRTCFVVVVQCDWFFSSWDEDVNVPVDEESEESSSISTMNHELLAKAESMGLLTTFSTLRHVELFLHHYTFVCV